MKKFTRIIFICVMAATVMSACGKKDKEVTLGQYKGLTYEKVDQTVTDAEMDALMASLQKKFIKYEVMEDRAGSTVKNGDFVTLDFGCIKNGYCSDMTRTVALGYATDEMKKVYQTVLDAQLAGIAISKAGVSGKAVDAAARDLIAAAGYGEYFGHSYGHSLGLEIHENPNCNMRNENPMPLHAVCSAEPGIYLPGKFGVRIEDVVIFEENCCTDITKSPKNLIIL